MASGEGRANPLCPGTSDIGPFSYSQSIIHLDAMLPDGALDCEMPGRSCAGQAILPCERLQSRSRRDDRGLTRENLMQVTSWRAQPRVGGRSGAAYLP
jgi:hypothetical protein